MNRTEQKIFIFEYGKIFYVNNTHLGKQKLQISTEMFKGKSLHTIS